MKHKIPICIIYAAQTKAAFLLRDPSRTLYQYYVVKKHVFTFPEMSSKRIKMWDEVDLGEFPGSTTMYVKYEAVQICGQRIFDSRFFLFLCWYTYPQHMFTLSAILHFQFLFNRY